MERQMLEEEFITNRWPMERKIINMKIENEREKHENQPASDIKKGKRKGRNNLWLA